MLATTQKLVQLLPVSVVLNAMSAMKRWLNMLYKMIRICLDFSKPFFHLTIIHQFLSL